MSSASSVPASTTRRTVVGIIAGSSFRHSTFFSALQEISIDTEKYGKVVARVNQDRSLVFIQRHHADPDQSYSPPHLINYRAIILALKKMDVSFIIGFGSVGSLKKTLPVSSVIVPDDYYHTQPMSFFDFSYSGHKVHSLDSNLRHRIISVLKAAGVNPVTTGTYTQTTGPRFESPAEIRGLALVGDVVGMTCVHEITLASEQDIPYALLGVIDNMANGLADKALTRAEFEAGVKKNQILSNSLMAIILAAFVPGHANSAPVAIPGAVSDDRELVDQVLHGRWVVPVEPANTVLENHSVIIKKGLIADILPTAQCVLKYRALQEENFSSSVLMPGLINAHTHMGMTLLRGFADDVELHEWLTGHIWPAEAQFVAPDFVQDSTELALTEMIRSGTTTINDMYWFPDVTAKIVDAIGFRALIGMTLLDFPTAYAANIDEYISKGVATRDAYKNHPLLDFAFAPHAPYTVCDAHLTRTKELAAAASNSGVSTKVHMHVHETLAECKDSEEGNATMSKHRSDEKCRPLANLDRLGLVDSNFIAVHMTQLTPNEIALCGNKKVNIVHCPSSNLKLASGMSPVWNLWKAGANVCLGTDSTASNNSLDMWSELKLAALLAKGVSNDATALPAWAALQMSTLNGAVALGIGHKVGSLKVGKEADIIAVALDDIESTPVFDVISHLVFSTSRDQVSDVWVKGKRLLREKKLECISQQNVLDRARAWQARIAEYRASQAKKRGTKRPAEE